MGDSAEIRYTVSRINLLQNHVNVFLPYLNNVSTLPCETWNAHHAHAVTESKIYFTFTVAFKFVRFESSWLQRGNIAIEGVKKPASLLWTYRRCYWQMAAAMMTWSSLAHSVLSRCFSSSRSVMCVLYTFSCNISHTLQSTRFRSG